MGRSDVRFPELFRERVHGFLSAAGELAAWQAHPALPQRVVQPKAAFRPELPDVARLASSLVEQQDRLAAAELQQAVARTALEQPVLQHVWESQALSLARAR